MPVTPNSTVYVLVVADVRDKTQMHYAFSSQAKADAFVAQLQVGAGLLPASTRGNITYIDLTLTVDSNIGA